MKDGLKDGIAAKTGVFVGYSELKKCNWLKSFTKEL
jgi:hypothetical protein